MIVGKRIQIRAIEYDDLSTLVAWRNTPGVYQFFYEHEPLSTIMQKSWFDKLLQRPNEKFWVAETIKDKQPIGTVGLNDIDWRNRKAELARVLIVDRFRGDGLGSELICLLLRYFFDHLNMNRLYCETLADNKGAIDFYKNLGFNQEAVFRQHVFKEGLYQDVVYLAILREEYLSNKTQTQIAKFIE